MKKILFLLALTTSTLLFAQPDVNGDFKTLKIHTVNHNSAIGLTISQGNDSGNRHSGRLFFENSGELSKSFVIMKSGDRLSFRANGQAGNNSGTEFMSLTNSGRLGIGTNNPTSFLDVHTTDYNSATGIVLTQGNGTGNTNSGRLFFENASDLSKSFVIMKAGNRLSFRANGQAGNNSGTEYMTLSSTGQVGIGTSSTGTHKLAVEGTIGAREIKVEANGWSDFVFDSNYKLRTLEEVEEHISEKGHLPEIPSEAEVTENGINLGEMNAKLLQKIEELTLYMIDMNKRVNELETENQELKEEISSLKSN